MIPSRRGPRVWGLWWASVGVVLWNSEIRGEVHYVDLAPVVNAALEDDGIARNGQGGWVDEGINDLYLYPPLPVGERTYRGYPFRVLEPSRSDGNSVLILRGQKRGQRFPEEITVRVNHAKGRYVFFLQHCAGPVEKTEGMLVATYTIHYADGAHHTVPVRYGREIHNWWVKNWWENAGQTRWPVHMGRNSHSRKWNYFVGLWATRWENPRPDMPITAIALRSTGKATPIIFAVTVSDEDYSAVAEKPARPPDVPLGYFDVKMKQEASRVFGEMTRLGFAVGIRSVEVLRNDIIAVTVDPAFRSMGAGPQEAEASAGQKPSNFLISSTTDPHYLSGANPEKVGRHSYEWWNGSIGPFHQNTIYWHTYTLFLPHPLESGHDYTVEVADIASEARETETIHYDAATTSTPVIKVNQVAYSGRAKRRYAYLGWWAGDAGRIDYGDCRKFQVIDEATGKQVLEGCPLLRRAEDPLSGEDVYELDIAPLDAGAYHLVVSGLGRSDTFRVGEPGIRELYFHTMRAFYHQRCGQALERPYTEFTKPACHTRIFRNGHPVKTEEDDATREFKGGYHDAADFDCFTTHLQATAQILAAYGFAPEKFQDGDLNIPESGNGFPDILDEADWALAGYRVLQEEDGGVPWGRGNGEDSLRQWKRRHGSVPPFGLFPPSAVSSNGYAAVAAYYARIVEKLRPERGALYLESARRAYAWAASHPSPEAVQEKEGNLLRAWAAAELFAATGDERYHDEFKRLYEPGFKRVHWKRQQVAPICWWSYITCSRPSVDRVIQNEVKQLLLAKASEVLKSSEKPPYRVGRGPRDRGNGWGNLNGGGYYADPCLRAYILTRDQKYLDAASLNADFQLGANPLSKTFISGLGRRPPRHPQISAFLYTGENKTGAAVKGLTVYGIAHDMPTWYPNETPSWRRWRDLGNGGAEISSEFTINETIGASAMLYAVLYALEP